MRFRIWRQGKHLFPAVAAIGLVVGAASSARADLTWSSAQNISGDSDVQTNGTVFAAYAFSSSESTPTTVNGITFEPFNALSKNSTSLGSGLASFTVGNITVSTTAGETVNGHDYDTFGSASAPFTNLSSAYQTLLGADVNTSASDSPLVMTVAIAGLTHRQSYQVELWVNDSRGPIGPYRSETLSGNNGPTLSFNTGSEGGLGQFVIGTFVAGGTSQSFTITGTSSNSGIQDVSQINALEVLTNVQSVPEPSSALICVVCGLIGSVGYAWRRRKRPALA